MGGQGLQLFDVTLAHDPDLPSILFQRKYISILCPAGLRFLAFDDFPVESRFLRRQVLPDEDLWSIQVLQTSSRSVDVVPRVIPAKLHNDDSRFLRGSGDVRV